MTKCQQDKAITHQGKEFEKLRLMLLHARASYVGIVPMHAQFELSAFFCVAILHSACTVVTTALLLSLQQHQVLCPGDLCHHSYILPCARRGCWSPQFSHHWPGGSNTSPRDSRHNCCNRLCLPLLQRI